MAQHPMKVVLLDLDGTLTKSDEGIIRSVVKTFEALNRPVPDDAELKRFIGPAIIESLRRNHVPEDQLDHAIDVYRSYYADKAVFDDPNEPGAKVPGRLVNVVFPGIPEQLERLRADGYYLALASCKPEYQCVPICEHFHLTGLLDGIYGASTDNSRLDKDQVIRYCFDNIGFDPDAGDKAIMIGDRYTDIDGARACGLDCIGCRWGYAPEGEMESHGAYRIIEQVSDIVPAVNAYFAEH
ncbi:HAD family hydrolase [Bifidobacterium sp. UBA744]|uniref:HAD family hydrolase n=1 Tax=Bifidobacterium sp. UBA744 TaxID=1946112 RepID=UPI0025BFE648|nr:HAD family hydrolase [Bifidobacterium sp. UBA744]